MKNLFVIAAMLLGSSALFTPAQASVYGYSTVNVNLRAGPSTKFPSVNVIKAGRDVQIHGCLSGFTWCDVSKGSSRGWMSGAYLQIDYQSHRYYIPYYAQTPAVIGVPVVTFDVDVYWGTYYRDSDFYVELDDWDDYVWDDDGLPPGWRDDWEEVVDVCEIGDAC